VLPITYGIFVSPRCKEQQLWDFLVGAASHLTMPFELNESSGVCIIYSIFVFPLMCSNSAVFMPAFLYCVLLRIYTRLARLSKIFLEHIFGSQRTRRICNIGGILKSGRLNLLVRRHLCRLLSDSFLLEGGAL